MAITVGKRHRIEETIKKSRFIAVCGRVNSEAEAQQFIKEEGHTDATHNAWAFRIGALYRCSDDGEPSGTAGRPILTALERMELDNAAVVVTRYFGGIKLGAGGLVRAYGGSAAQCLREAPKHEIRPRVRCRLSIRFADSSAVFRYLEGSPAEKFAEKFTAEGVAFQLLMDERDYQRFAEEIGNLTRGTARLEVQSVTMT